MWVYFKVICFDEVCCLFSQYQVYFSGFLHAHVEKLTALLHLVGAVRLKQLNSAVTHVLVGQQDQEETAKLARVGDRCVCVFAWCNKREGRRERERRVME